MASIDAEDAISLVEDRVDEVEDLIMVHVRGSHLWGEAAEDSDVDFFVVEVKDPRELMAGRSVNVSNHYEDGDLDVVHYNAGHVVDQLCSANYNFVLGVLSEHPANIRDADGEWLRELASEHIGTGMAESARGIAHQYAERGDYRKACRSLQFYEDYFVEDWPQFEVPEHDDYEQFYDYLKRQSDVLQNKFDYETDGSKFRAWLERVRMVRIHNLRRGV